MTPSRASADGSPGTPSILGTAAVEQGALLVTDAGHRGPRGEGSRAAPRGGCAVARERTELRDWRRRKFHSLDELADRLLRFGEHYRQIAMTV